MPPPVACQRGCCDTMGQSVMTSRHSAPRGCKPWNPPKLWRCRSGAAFAAVNGHKVQWQARLVHGAYKRSQLLGPADTKLGTNRLAATVTHATRKTGRAGAGAGQGRAGRGSNNVKKGLTGGNAVHGMEAARPTLGRVAFEQTASSQRGR